MALRDRILEALVAEYPETLTNNQLAHRLDANEPSVRRVTNQLANAGEIQDYKGGYAGLPIEWRAP